MGNYHIYTVNCQALSLPLENVPTLTVDDGEHLTGASCPGEQYECRQLLASKASNSEPGRSTDVTRDAGHQSVGGSVKGRLANSAHGTNGGIEN